MTNINVRDYKGELTAGIAYANRYSFEIKDIPDDAKFYAINISNLGMNPGDAFEVEYYDVHRDVDLDLFYDFKKILENRKVLDYKLIQLNNDGFSEIRQHIGSAIVENIYVNFSFESEELSKFTVVFRNTRPVVTK